MSTASPAPQLKLSRNAKRAIASYGRQKCVDAFEMTKPGDGASTIGFSLGLTTTAIADSREQAAGAQ
ncbi:hypothetical protein SAMN05878276_0718 [Aquipseudomonas alcaligenes]|uniref:hypothetical protein n=1 Tax=Aquipseudomonas alcaligenes TaxID=43263 RepID=UPI0009543D3E|nr:hypothetical protein [Pseudomonas alcaligenes]SIR86567.1 hypothetical protein SAMN05878276_0718 [Pseudomonas alcaligenes]